MKYFSYKDGCGICVSRHSKEKLTWATDKWLWSSYISEELKNEFKLKQYCTCCYVLLANMWQIVGFHIFLLMPQLYAWHYAAIF